ncbi:hypothetical protein HG530_007583 [Fusarium avenaceum]|nr:hypothetical protein HG530_007583 [Fusarium avenaceum]
MTPSIFLHGFSPDHAQVKNFFSDGVELAGDGAVVWSEVVGFGQIAQGSLLVLEANVGVTAAIECLCAIGVLNASDVKSSRGGAGSIVPGLKLDVEKGRVVVESEAQGLKLVLDGLGLILELRLLVDVAQSLLVLVEAKRVIARLESSVSVILACLCDLEDGKGIESVGAVLREVLVRVAEGIRLLHIGSEGGIASQLATVGNESLLGRTVAGLGGKVLNLADDGFSVQNLSEDDVLAIEVRGRHGGYEELRAVGVYGGVMAVSVMTRHGMIGLKLDKTYWDRHWP